MTQWRGSDREALTRSYLHIDTKHSRPKLRASSPKARHNWRIPGCADAIHGQSPGTSAASCMGGAAQCSQAGLDHKFVIILNKVPSHASLQLTAGLFKVLKSAGSRLGASGSRALVEGRASPFPLHLRVFVVSLEPSSKPRAWYSTYDTARRSAGIHVLVPWAYLRRRCKPTAG